MLVGALLVLGACTPGPSPTPDPTPAPTARSTPTGGRGITLESVVSVPGGQTGSTWSFPEDEDAFDVRIRLSGEGTVAARLELRAEPSGEVVDSQEERIAVSGPTQVTFDGLPIPRRGGYTLDLRISGDGISQRSTVTIRRG